MRRAFAGLAGLAFMAAATGMVFSRSYWGYWIRQPSIVPWVRGLQSADRLVFVECRQGSASRFTAVTPTEARQGAMLYRQSPSDYPGYQLLAALESVQLPVTQVDARERDLETVCERLNRSGVVVEGAPGYAYAGYVRGFLIHGRTVSNERTWIWSAIGGEVSNDHHPVYDLQFVNGALTRSHVYFEDIAGIEGVRWYFVAAVVFAPGALLLIAALLVASIARVARRRLTRVAVDSG